MLYFCIPSISQLDFFRLTCSIAFLATTGLPSRGCLCFVSSCVPARPCASPRHTWPCVCSETVCSFQQTCFHGPIKDEAHAAAPLQRETKRAETGEGGSHEFNDGNHDRLPTGKGSLVSGGKDGRKTNNAARSRKTANGGLEQRRKKRRDELMPAEEDGREAGWRREGGSHNSSRKLPATDARAESCSFRDSSQRGWNVITAPGRERGRNGQGASQPKLTPASRWRPTAATAFQFQRKSEPNASQRHELPMHISQFNNWPSPTGIKCQMGENKM